MSVLATIGLVSVLANPLGQGMDFNQLRDAIKPKAHELAWEGVEWKPTLWQAVDQAQREDKPILLWAMNGHPMACT